MDLILLVLALCLVQICRNPQAKQEHLVKIAIQRAKNTENGSCLGIAAYDNGDLVDLDHQAALA